MKMNLVKALVMSAVVFGCSNSPTGTVERSTLRLASHGTADINGPILLTQTIFYDWTVDLDYSQPVNISWRRIQDGVGYAWGSNETVSYKPDSGVYSFTWELSVTPDCNGLCLAWVEIWTRDVYVCIPHTGSCDS